MKLAIYGNIFIVMFHIQAPMDILCECFLKFNMKNYIAIYVHEKPWKEYALFWVATTNENLGAIIYMHFWCMYKDVHVVKTKSTKLGMYATALRKTYQNSKSASCRNFQWSLSLSEL